MAEWAREPANLDEYIMLSLHVAGPSSIAIAYKSEHIIICYIEIFGEYSLW